MSDKTLLNDQQKLDLKNMIKANDTEDCTEEIRKKKQSILIIFFQMELISFMSFLVLTIK